jgi:DNA polymerase-3 subunit epsilon
VRDLERIKAMGVFDFLFGSRREKLAPATTAAMPSQARGPAYAVIDVETTGLSPKTERVLELAIVRVDERGIVVDEFVQRFNPEGPVGATHIHGIRDVDVAQSPFFHQVSIVIAEKLRGLPVVAHNANFDLAFLRAEFRGAGWKLPYLASYCTLEGSYDYLPDAERRRLVDCCWATGVTLNDAHSALGDARATAGLLGAYLAHGGPAQDALSEAATIASRASWPTGPDQAPLSREERNEASGRPRPFRIAPPKPKAPALIRQISTLSLAEVIDEGAPAGTTAYIELLFAALEDGEISESEVVELTEIQQAYNLTDSDISAAHEAFLLALAHAAVDDGHISHDERAELHDLARLLSVPTVKVKSVIDRADAARHARLGSTLGPLPETWTLGEPLRVGDRVAFTGCDEGQRERLEKQAEQLGVRVMNNVSKLTVTLVTDGSFSGGKLAKATELGTRLVHPRDFEVLLQHLQPATRTEPKASARQAATATAAPTGTGSHTTAQPSPAVIRAWAIAHGYEVGVRGAFTAQSSRPSLKRTLRPRHRQKAL